MTWIMIFNEIKVQEFKFCNRSKLMGPIELQIETMWTQFLQINELLPILYSSVVHIESDFNSTKKSDSNYILYMLAYL